jgi:hypothetical protein
MQTDVPVHATLGERWAAHASDSQFNALAGAIGGFTSGIVTCPLDVIKTKLQAQGGFAAVQKGRHVGHHKVYEGLIGTGRVIWREEGLRGMYRGLGPIIMGYLPTWAVWFTVYNKSKVYLATKHGRFPPCSVRVAHCRLMWRKHRKHLCDKLLVVHNSGSEQYHRHEPDMGDQDQTHVPIGHA